MNDLPAIDDDLKCAHCGYNLRGMTREDLCPECALPVRLSLFALDVAQQSQFSDPILLAARTSQTSSRACMLVLKAVRQGLLVHQTFAPRGTRPSQIISAAEICDALRDLISETADTDHAARALLDSIGLRSSEDLGRIVFALAEQSQLQVSGRDSEQDFVGLFRLDTFSIKP